MTPGTLRASVPFFVDARVLRVARLADVVSLNNTNYRVDADGQSFLLRVGAQTAHWLGVRRDEELAAARAAAEVGVAPTVLWADGAGTMVQNFVAGGHWQAPALADPSQQTRLADALQRLHAQNSVAAPCTVYARIERLMESARALNLPLTDGLEALQARLSAFAARRAPKVRPSLCHNDLWLNNFLDDGERLWLVDWEFAGVGDHLYDLTTLAMAGQLSTEGRQSLLAAYGSTDPDDLIDMAEMEQVVRAFEGAWALVMHCLRGSEGGFDYKTYADRCFAALVGNQD